MTTVENSALSRQVERVGDALAVPVDLGGLDVLRRRHVAGLFEQRQIDHGRGVAHRTRVPVPVPRTAEVAADLDDPHVVDPRLLQARADTQPGEAATDQRDGDLVEEWLAFGPLGVGIVEHRGEAARRFEVLVVAVVPQPLVAFLAVLDPQRVVIHRHLASVTAATGAPHHVVGAPKMSRRGRPSAAPNAVHPRDPHCVRVPRCELREYRATAVRTQRLGRRVGLVQRARTRRVVDVPVVHDGAGLVATDIHHRGGHLAEALRVEDLEADHEPHPLAVAHEEKVAARSPPTHRRSTRPDGVARFPAHEYRLVMRDFAGRRAVVTGGGSGMGRELVRQLAAEGCHVATCDVSDESLAETRAVAEQDASSDTRISTFVADVTDEAQWQAFREHVATEHDTDSVNLLFNNAGIGGGGSFVTEAREPWDATFAVCWGGVYLGCRTFLPMLIAADEAHIVNTSSVNGFWASLGPGTPHTAYSAAKFAVKGFTEALVTDLRLNAPHVKASVVMPGHIGTGIVLNSLRYFGLDPKHLDAEQLAQMRSRLASQGIDVTGASDEDLGNGMQLQAEMFRDLAPTTAAQAFTIILDGVRADRWRILVGADAEQLDRLVRETPEDAYEPSFMERVRAQGIFGAIPL